MSNELTDKDFRQGIALTLAGNPEFIKSAVNGYDHKHVGFCVAEQITLTISKLNKLENKEK